MSQKPLTKTQDVAYRLLSHPFLTHKDLPLIDAHLALNARRLAELIPVVPGEKSMSQEPIELTPSQIDSRLVRPEDFIVRKYNDPLTEPFHGQSTNEKRDDAE